MLLDFIVMHLGFGRNEGLDSGFLVGRFAEEGPRT